jgi:hypothetical protein
MTVQPQMFPLAGNGNGCTRIPNLSAIKYKNYFAEPYRFTTRVTETHERG